MEDTNNSVYVENSTYSNFGQCSSAVEKVDEASLLDVIDILNTEVLGNMENSYNSECITQQMFSDIGTNQMNVISHQIVPDHADYPCLSDIGNNFFFIDEILSEHKESEPVSETLLCFDCGIQCMDENELGEHILMEHDDKFHCPECDFVCSDKKNLLQHLRNTHPQVVAECKEKSKKIECIALDSDDDLLSIEDFQRKNLNKLKRLYYDSNYNTEKSRIHSHDSLLNDILQTKDFKCHTHSEARQHRILAHVPYKPFRCTTCDYKCKRNADLQTHEMRHKIDDRPYECLKCRFKCIGRPLLRKHMQTHAKVKSYSCLICGKILSSTIALNNHMMIHTGEKPFSCEECNFTTRVANSLHMHMQAHSTGERPYVCDQCDYRAASKTTLDSHKWTHVKVLARHKEKFTFDL